MIYKGILKERTPLTKVLLLIFSMALIIFEYETHQYFYIPLTFLVVLAVFRKKEHIVSEEGVEIRRSVFGMESRNIWKWDEVTAIQPDFEKFKPNVRLQIAKDVTIRPFMFTPSDAKAVMELATKMNPDIYIDYETEEEQEENDRKTLHDQEVERAQKAQKANKRK